MKKLRNLMASLMLTVSLGVWADSYAYLTVSQTGEDTSFQISQISKITFSESSMLIHLTNGETQSLPLAALSKMFFSENGSAGIGGLSIDQEARARMEGGLLKVSAKGGAHIIIYNMGGAVVKSLSTTADETEVNVSELPKGVYIVKTNGKSQKVMK